MAIVLALVYRATRDEESAANRFTLETISIPIGAVVLSIVPVNNVIVVTYENDGQTMMRIVDTQTGAIEKEIPVIAE